MYNLLIKNGQAIAFGLGVLITVLFLVLIFSGLENFNAASDAAKLDTNIFNFGIYAALGLTALCFIISVLFSIYQIATNPKDSLKGLLGIAALVAVFVIAYAISGPAPEGTYLANVESNFDITPNQSKLISSQIFTALILSGIAAVAFVASEVINFFK